MTNPFENADGSYRVLVNCIERNWVDLRPRSLRS
jgi:uncharacterized protein YbdZ (MbtH family)